MKLSYLGVFVFVVSMLSIQTPSASKLYLDPAGGTFIKHCPFTVNVMMDTQHQEVKTIDVKFDFDRDVLSYVNMSNGAFASYTTVVDRLTKIGKPMIGFGAFTFTNAPVQGSAVLVASMAFSSLGNVGSGVIDFYMIPGVGTDDSNVPQTVDGVTRDTLNEAIGGKYTFIDGVCASDSSIVGQGFIDRKDCNDIEYAPICVLESLNPSEILPQKTFRNKCFAFKGGYNPDGVSTGLCPADKIEPSMDQVSTVQKVLDIVFRKYRKTGSYRLSPTGTLFAIKIYEQVLSLIDKQRDQRTGVLGQNNDKLSLLYAIRDYLWTMY